MVPTVRHSLLACSILLTLSVTAQDGDTALILAARWGRTDVVVELVRGGANLDMQDEVYMLSDE